MDRNQIPMQACPRLGFVQSTDIQFRPAADGGPRLSTPGQTLPPPPPLVRHGQITSAATTGSVGVGALLDEHFRRSLTHYSTASTGVGNGTPVAATSGNSMRPGINPSLSQPSFSGFPPQGVQQYNWVSPDNGTFIRKHWTLQGVPGDPLIRQALRQQLQHGQNNSPNIVPGSYSYGSFPDRLSAPSRDHQFMPGSQPQSVPGLRHGAPHYRANFNQAGSVSNTKQVLVNQSMRDLPAAHQGVVRVPHPAHHHALGGLSGQSFSANQRLAHVDSTYSLGPHNKRQFVSQSVQEHTSPAQAPYPSQPMPGHISPGHFQSMQGHISPGYSQQMQGNISPGYSQQMQGHISPGNSQQMQGNISPGYSQQMQGNISPGYCQQIQGHISPGSSQQMQGHIPPRNSQPIQGNISPGNSHSIKGHVSPAQSLVRMSGQEYIVQGLSNNEQNLSRPQAQGSLPRQFQQQMGSVNGQESISGWQQNKGHTISQDCIDIANAATSLSFLTENRKVLQLRSEFRDKILQCKERMEKPENHGILSTGETVDEMIGRMIEKIKERESGNLQKSLQNQQHSVVQTHTTSATLTSLQKVKQDNVSAIQSAFAIPASNAPHDKGVLSRWYALPLAQSNPSSHTSTSNTSSIINSEASPSTCTGPSQTSGLVSDSSPTNNSEVTSLPTTETAAITTSVSTCNMPSYSEEPFMLKPIVCNENDIKYSVADLLRCLPKKVRLRHSSSIDSDKSTEFMKNDTTMTSEKTPVESDQIEQNLCLPPVASICEKPSESTENVPGKISSREITPDLDEQLMETDSLLDHSKNQLLDRLVLNSHFGTQDMNPEIDYRNYLPSPGFPADFVMTPSPDFNMKEESTTNCETADAPSEVSSCDQNKKLGAPGEIEKSNSQTSDGKGSLQKQAVDKDEIDNVQPKKKRKLGAISGSNLSKPTLQVKRQRGDSQGRGRGCQQRGGRGRGRGKGRGRQWAVSLTRNKNQNKPALVTRKQTARCSRGKGKLKANFYKEGNAVDTSKQTHSTVAGLEGQVIQKPQDLKKLMDNLPHEELEKTTVSLSFLKMMLAWQEAKTNAGPDDVDQESDTASVTSVGDEPKVNDGKTLDNQEEKSKINTKEHNDHVSKVNLEERENSDKILKSDEQYNNMANMGIPSVESSSSMLSDKPVAVCARSNDKYENKHVTECEHNKNGNSSINEKSDNNANKSAETGKQNVEAFNKEVTETTDDTARAVMDLGDASNQDICLKQNNNGTFGNRIPDLPTISKETEYQQDAPTKNSQDDKNKSEHRIKHLLNENDKIDTKICDISNNTSKSSTDADACSENKENAASKAVSEQKKADIEVTAVDNTLATQVYSVTSTHKMTWVRFHGRTVTHLITPNGKFFILKEILRRCFRIQEPNKNLQFNRIGSLKRKVLKIPDIELEPVFYDYVVKNLIDRKVIKTVPDKFIIISEEDANRLFHHVCKDQYCGSACVTPFFQKQTSSTLKTEKTEQVGLATATLKAEKTEKVGLATASDNAIAGSSINSNNTPLPEKGRNLFDVLEKEDSSKLEKTQKKGEDKEKQVEIIDMCSHEDESNGYDSDKTLPYVDGKPLTIEELEIESNCESVSTGEKSGLSEKPDRIESDAIANFDKNLNNEIRGRIECQDKAKLEKQETSDLANKGSDLSLDISLSEKNFVSNSAEKSKTVDVISSECADRKSPVVSAFKNVHCVSNRKSESQGLTSSEIRKIDESQVSDCDVIVIDDDDDDELENQIIESAEDQPDEVGICKLTLDQMKKEISVLNQEHVNSMESERHSAELVQVNNIDSTAVSVNGDTHENKDTRIHLGNNQRSIFDICDKNYEKFKNNVSGTGDIVKDGTDISDTDNVVVSVSNENDDLSSDGVDADVIIGDWIFPQPPKNYPENGTKKLEEAGETLEKIIEQANSAKSTEDYVDILDTVFKLKEPLQQWTNTLLDHYEESLLIEAQRLKSLDQLQLTDN